MLAGQRPMIRESSYRCEYRSPLSTAGSAILTGAPAWPPFWRAKRPEFFALYAKKCEAAENPNPWISLRASLTLR